ncbi:MAG: hypothetical protein WBZ48_13435 [Bacteroidota bacterium]
MKFGHKLIKEKGNEILQKQSCTEIEFLQRVIPIFAKDLLEKGQNYWTEFGMYWYNLQDVIRHYAPKEYRSYADYIGGEELFGADSKIKKEYDMGTEFHNWIAAQFYLDIRFATMEFGNSPHQHEDADGEIFEYVTGVGIIPPGRE